MEITGAMGSAKEMFRYVMTALEEPDLGSAVINSPTLWETYQQGVLAIYEKHFTNEQLLGMIAFYNTDIGKTVIETMPEILTETLCLGEAWGADVADMLLNHSDPIAPTPLVVDVR
jgi:hypothetical protein